MLLSLYCYKLACHYFLHLHSTLCTHTYHISCIFLLYSATQKMKSSLMKTSSRRAGLQSSTCGVVPYFAVYTSWSCKMFFIRLDVINTSYIVHFTTS
jgi:hypothetical protein